jgi:hypothetical protein
MMKRIGWILVVAAALCMLAPTSALALGPVDVEVKAVYWQAEVNSDGTKADLDGPGIEASVWLLNKKLGITGALYQTEGSGLAEGLDVDFTSLDVKWRLLNPTEHNYLAVGLGYQQNDFDTFISVDTSGVRILVEGNFGIVGILQGYGRYVYLPSLDDNVLFTDADATEFEAGVELKFGLLSIHGGYRAHNITFSDGGSGSVDFDTDGFVAGVGVQF